MLLFSLLALALLLPALTNPSLLIIFAPYFPFSSPHDGPSFVYAYPSRRSLKCLSSLSSLVPLPSCPPPSPFFYPLSLPLTVPSLPPGPPCLFIFSTRYDQDSAATTAAAAGPPSSPAAQPLISGIVWADSAGQMRRRPMGTRLASLLPPRLTLASS